MAANPNSLQITPDRRASYLHGRKYRRTQRRNHEEPARRLSETGLAIFRPVETSQLQPVFEVMCSAIGDFLITHRLNYDQKPAAISLVELREAHNQVLLKGTATREAIEVVHAEVPSLQKPIIVRPSGLLFISRGPNAKALGITLSPEDSDLLGAERREALDVIEGLAIPGQPHEFTWLRGKLPHISLGRIASEHLNQISPEVMEPVVEALPEEIRVRRATFYTPPSDN
jgi:hypothetical protein